MLMSPSSTLTANASHARKALRQFTISNRSSVAINTMGSTNGAVPNVVKR